MSLYRVTVDAVNPDAETCDSCIPFSAGNPQIEHILGQLHLYRPRVVPGRAGAAPDVRRLRARVPRALLQTARKLRARAGGRHGPGVRAGGAGRARLP